MKAPKLASIVISSYNYGRFLGDAVDSALAQTYPNTEVIVVDDGSTDGSREIIATYGSAVSAVFKPTGGQASALNAGFTRSKGDVIVFLDSDDVLLPTALSTAVELLSDPVVGKVHWPLWELDERGARTGKMRPDWCSPSDLADGNVLDAVLGAGPDGYSWPPTSGNAWARRVLERILPVPEPEFRTCPDFYLAALAPLYGEMRRVLEPQSCWRKHGRNQSSSESAERRLSGTRARLGCCLVAVRRHCTALGLPFDLASCRDNSWTEWEHRIHQAIRDIEQVVPAGNSCILVNENTWPDREASLCRRRLIPFLEKDGAYWGRPADDETAIRELGRLRQLGARFVVFAWPAFWWLDYYKGLRAHLRSQFRCVLENERVIGFDLRG